MELISEDQTVDPLISAYDKTFISIFFLIGLYRLYLSEAQPACGGFNVSVVRAYETKINDKGISHLIHVTLIEQVISMI